MTAADVLYGLAIVVGAIALVAAEDLFAAWARSRSMRAILGRRHAENTRGRAEKPNAPDCSEAPVPILRSGAPTMPDAHRDVKPYNTPPCAAGGSDAEHREP